MEKVSILLRASEILNQMESRQIGLANDPSYDGVQLIPKLSADGEQSNNSMSTNFKRTSMHYFIWYEICHLEKQHEHPM